MQNKSLELPLGSSLSWILVNCRSFVAVFVGSQVGVANGEPQVSPSICANAVYFAVAIVGKCLAFKPFIHVGETYKFNRRRHW